MNTYASQATGTLTELTNDSRYASWIVDQDIPHSEAHLCCGAPDVVAQTWERYVTAAHEEAYAENERRSIPDEPLPSGNLRIVEESQEDRDARAAEAQAELLGATPDQRAKLRQIVADRRDALAEVARLQEEVARLREPIRNAEDDRVIGLFVNAAEEADRQGYCTTYDQIADAVGLPTRDRLTDLGYLTKTWDVDTEITLSVMRTITVVAGNEQDAMSQVDSMSYSEIAEHTDLDPYQISGVDAQSAERVDD